MKSTSRTNKTSLHDLVMKFMKKKRSAYIVTLTMLAVLPARYAQGLGVTSLTFSKGGTFPLTMVGNATSSCGFFNGSNKSPELEWSLPPVGTLSFVVMMEDNNAGFTHWGMYNIPAETRELPLNAGVAGSSFGPQVLNGYGRAEYDGPCPPPDITPTRHFYIFRLYALDKMLDLPSSTNFPATADTLYLALIQAGRDGHILASTTTGGFFPAR